jgi:hypothetical protein
MSALSRDRHLGWHRQIKLWQIITRCKLNAVPKKTGFGTSKRPVLMHLIFKLGIAIISGAAIAAVAAEVLLK